MINYWIQNGKELQQVPVFEPGCWVDVVAPTQEEIELLQENYDLPGEIVIDILDTEERSRFEREEDYLLIIIRVPFHDEDANVPYTTIPFGFVQKDDTLFTICLSDNEIRRDVTYRRIRGVNIESNKSFIFLLFMRAAMWYMKYLREIHHFTTIIEDELHTSVENHELVKLLQMEKCLVYFSTALKSNEFLMERLQRTVYNRVSEEDADLLEDVLIENRQAIEMANIYSNILASLMDTFGSLINNNMNKVMKTLALTSIALLGPTYLASLFGMNVKLPFVDSAGDQPYIFFIVLILSVLLTIFTYSVVQWIVKRNR